jgi:hypothetical protein
MRLRPVKNPPNSGQGLNQATTQQAIQLAELFAPLSLCVFVLLWSLIVASPLCCIDLCHVASLCACCGHAGSRQRLVRYAKCTDARQRLRSQTLTRSCVAAVDNWGYDDSSTTLLGMYRLVSNSEALGRFMKSNESALTRSISQPCRGSINAICYHRSDAMGPSQCPVQRSLPIANRYPDQYLDR